MATLYKTYFLFCRGCPLKVPFIHGVELDLYKLYDAVISYGGYQKVSNAERWSDILKEMSIDENVQVADHGIKSIYMRYLSKYEQTEFGRDNDDHEQELMMSSRSSRLKGLTLLAYTESPVPMPKHCKQRIMFFYVVLYGTWQTEWKVTSLSF